MAMLIRLLKQATISGTPFPEGMKITVSDSAAEYLVSVGGAVPVVEEEEAQDEPGNPANSPETDSATSRVRRHGTKR